MRPLRLRVDDGWRVDDEARVGEVRRVIGWQQAWGEALYGATGFYRGASGPAGHFTTSAHGPLGEAMARAVVSLASRESASLVVDIGCGRGELLSAVDRLGAGLRLLGVDVVARPEGLPREVEWMESPGGAELPAGLDGLEHALVIANEWLDVVPLVVASAGADGMLREVLVDPESGAESVGDVLGGADLAWAQQWWPSWKTGDRIEVGRSRDLAWAELLSRIRSGTAVAIDYGHTRDSRPGGGTLIGYREGTATTPVPDGSCDITAHVAMDSLAHDDLLSQRDALRQLGIGAATPPRELASADPAGYLAALAQASGEGALLSALGDFWWAISRVG